MNDTANEDNSSEDYPNEEGLLKILHQKVEYWNSEYNKIIEHETAFLKKYYSKFKEEEFKYNKVKCDILTYDWLSIIYGTENQVSKAILNEAGINCSEIRFANAKNRLYQIIQSKKDKNINRESNINFMDEDKFFNACKTLWQLIFENIDDAKNKINKTDITLKLAEAVDEKKINDSDAKAVKQVFKYYIMAEHIRKEYSDHQNYASLRNTALTAYKNICENSKSILLQYVDKKFLNIEDTK